MLTTSSTFHTGSLFKSSMFTTLAAVALLHSFPALAKTNVTNTVAKGARTCVSSGACSTTPTGKAFGGAVRSMDRLGWEIGRGMSIKKYGPAGDPGRYPGINR